MMQSSKRSFTTLFFVVIFIAFPVFLIVNFMYPNSTFPLFESFTKVNVVVLRGENTQNQNLTNVTTNIFPLEGRFHHVNISETGLKIGSLTSTTNDSTSHTHDKDKLLDGLLASGFDEESCISRFQSHLYRKGSSPHKPSSNLISKLRNYEEIHTKCGPNSRAYKKNMTKILHSKNKASASAAAMCKYLVWTPANGLGNQMISLAATFLYALLTDRVLLVKFGEDKHGLFCEPFRNSTWLLPEKSPFWNENHVATYQSMTKKDKTDTSKEDLPSVLFLSLQYTSSDPKNFFHCDHNQDLLNKVPLLILQSDQYFVPSLFMSSTFNKELNKMFPKIDTVFHHLGRYLFHPSNEAWGLISNFYRAHLAKADEKIGLQIRVFNPKSTSQETVMKLVLNCTIQNKLLPQVGTQTSISSSDKNHTVKAVLVTSLYPEYGANLRDMYTNKSTVTGEVIKVYQPSHEESQKFDDNKHNMKAWVDMYLLSLSDILVTTSLSTFGYVAQGLGNLRPWLLYKLVSNHTHFPACEQDFSLEPCYHSPPKHYCSGKSIEDFDSLQYLRRCKDFWFGVKLNNSSM